jgi:hypothetical protein
MAWNGYGALDKAWTSQLAACSIAMIVSRALASSRLFSYRNNFRSAAFRTIFHPTTEERRTARAVFQFLIFNSGGLPQAISFLDVPRIFFD